MISEGSQQMGKWKCLSNASPTGTDPFLHSQLKVGAGPLTPHMGTLLFASALTLVLSQLSRRQREWGFSFPILEMEK